MSNENLDHLQALERAATLIEKNGEEWNSDLNTRVNSLYKSRHMTELNKSRATWMADHAKSLLDERVGGYEAGRKECEEKMRWVVPCCDCHKPMVFSSEDPDFKHIYDVLARAFEDWLCGDCFKTA